MSEVELKVGEWRCAGCGNRDHVTACAEAIVFGTVDGPEEVTEDDTEQVGLCGGSVECRVHQGTEPLERWDGEHWVRWHPCEECEGTGAVTNPREVFSRVRLTCRRCFGQGGWWPGLTRNPFGAH